MVNRIAFFNKLRTFNLFTRLNRGQIDGMNAIIDEWISNTAYTDIRWLSYMLATVYHETGRTMQPIEEFGRGVGKPYGSKLKYGGGPGKRVPYTKPDKIYFGRGLTQNTWYEVYERLSKTQRAKTEGWDFLNNPELLLQMKPSVWAMYYAMTNGIYTGRKLSQYFNESKCDPLNARKIINKLDKAELIKLYHEKFLKCLL